MVKFLCMIKSTMTFLDKQSTFFVCLFTINREHPSMMLLNVEHSFEISYIQFDRGTHIFNFNLKILFHFEYFSIQLLLSIIFM